jgi:16S rRNA (guanine527-N7)-methyltransferase
MLRQAGRHCARDGVLLAMKGGEPGAELAALPGGYKVQAVHRLTVPGLREERHLVCLTPAEDDKRD